MATYRWLIVLALCLGNRVGAQNVLTGGYDNGRTNADLAETILTPSTVSAARFGKLFSLPVDGQIYAQPLYLRNLQVPGKGVHNTIFAATMHNSVYAWDADTPGPPLWTVNLGTPVPSSDYDTDEEYTDITPEIGILGTPVIDPATATLYLVAATRESGVYYYRLHALDVATGAERFGAPTVVGAQVVGIGDNSQSGTVRFVASQHLQRPALLLLNGVVYVSFGSHGDAAPYHGWILGYSATNVQTQVAVFNPTPNGSGGAFWQSGRGLAADGKGSIYAVSANGTTDGASAYGNSVLKLTPLDLSLTDWFAPFNVQLLNDTDDDLGTSGPLLIPGTSLLVTGGKDGYIYLMDTGSLGQIAVDNSQIVQTFAAATFGIFNMALWNRATGPVLYLHGGNVPFTAHRLPAGRIDPVPVSRSIEAYDVPFQGMTISANGGQPGSGILWTTTADTYPFPSPGTLRAFNADDLSVELWDSAMNPDTDALGLFVKFANPTVANGKVYVPTMSNQLAVYGLKTAETLPVPVITAVVNAASYANGPLAPGEVVTIFGLNLGPQTLVPGSFDPGGRLSTELGGTQVFFNGIPAPLLYSSAGVATAIVPFELTGSEYTSVRVACYGRNSVAQTFPMAGTAPGIFSADASGRGPGAVLNQDYTLNSPDNPAPGGSIIAIYATGGGVTEPPGTTGSAAPGLTRLVSRVSVTVADVDAEVVYAGSAPTEVEGLLQINVRLPADIGSGQVPVVLNVGGRASQSALTVTVR